MNLYNLDQKRVGEWADKVFGDREKFPDRDILLHLIEEVGELIRDPASGEEMADIVLVIMHLAHRKGVDLSLEIIAKFDLCERSKWYFDDKFGRMRRVKGPHLSTDGEPA